MCSQFATKFCSTQSVVSIPEVNKHSESKIAKSGVVIYHNPPVTNFVEDFNNRLEVVSKLVPQHEIQQVYGDFVKKLSEVCYESVAKQLVRSSRSSSVVSSTCSRNIRPTIKENNLETDNAINSTMHRLFSAAEGVRKHLTTISESSSREGLLLPLKSTSEQRKLKTISRENRRIVNDRVNHLRSSTSKSSRKVISIRRKKNLVEESGMELVETEFNITKDSLRNSNVVVHEENKKITTIRRKSKTPRRINGARKTVVDVNRSVSCSITEELSHQIHVKRKKTALSPFFNRFYKQSHSHPRKMLPIQI